MYTVKFSKQAAKEYEKLPKSIQSRIDDKLDYLRNSPRGHDTKQLQGYVGSTYRTRVGDYRIVYEIQDTELIVWIVKIGHRREIYK